jgi:biotin synthase
MNSTPTRADILDWLREDDGRKIAQLWEVADQTRRTQVGDEVHLRGLIEVSNHCARQCAYCGLRAGHQALRRYRMTASEIIAGARLAHELGYGTVVLQAGEDDALTADFMAEVIRDIKAETGLAITLSLGERSEADLSAWKQAGADRYLLRFETSDARLYQRIHPARHGMSMDRIALLGKLKQLGYEVGSGIMVGLPGQTLPSLAEDILLFHELDLDMIGIGPFLAHPATPLGRHALESATAALADQAPASELLVYKIIALTRLVCPAANIPSTTALATLNPRDGRELGLQRGANVCMPNLTPAKYRRHYEIYPDKACMQETAQACHSCLTARIRRLGRQVGRGPGGRYDRRRRASSEPGGIIPKILCQPLR